MHRRLHYFLSKLCNHYPLIITIDSVAGQENCVNEGLKEDRHGKIKI